MRFLRYSLPLVCLSIANSQALSNQANDVLDDMSTIEKSLHSNKKALDRYQGGIGGATPLLTGFYNTWASLRTANAHMPRDTNFTSEDSGAIFDSLSTSDNLAIDLFRAFEEKAQLFHQSGTSFLIPIFMEALDHEVDQYSTSLTHMMSENYKAPMAQMRTKHLEAWDATFDTYEPVGNSDRNEIVMRFASKVTPVLGLLPL